MVGVPAATPVTIPELVPIVASAMLLLVQVPPVVASVNVIDEPTQTAVEPAIDAGIGLTVNGHNDVQPPGMV